MATIQIIKRARANKNGLHPLQLRITMGKKVVRKNIGKAVAPEHWNDQTNTLKKSHPNYRAMLAYISDKLNAANQEALVLQTSRRDYTITMLKNKVSGGQTFETFFSQADEFFEQLKLAGKVNRFYGERPVINHLRRFANGKDLAFADITPSYLLRFRAYLFGKHGISESTAASYFTTIRKIFNRAIQNGHATPEQYPFGKGKVTIKYPQSLKIGLEDYEVQKIENLDLDENTYIYHARNIWLFSFYFAGMRASDVLRLEWNAIYNDRLHYSMGKNNKPGSFKIPEKAQQILNHYSRYKCIRTNLVFPDLRDSPSLTDQAIYKPRIKNRIKKLNKYLKQIAELAEIGKPLTMHIARHTFGNIAGDKIPIQKLQQLYRHSSIETTIGYQKAFMNKGSDDALEAVVNFSVSGA